MSETAYGFTARDAGKIAEVVNNQRTPQSNATARRRAQLHPMPDLVKITDALDGSGKYEGVELIPGASVTWDPAADAAESDFGTAGAKCYVINTAEIGTDSHCLTEEPVIISIWPAKYLYDVIEPADDEDDPPTITPVYAVTAVDDFWCDEDEDEE